jgi:ribonuclease HI
MNFTIVCDGGSLGNNVAGGGEGYGSFVILPDVMTQRFTQRFGPKITNNEAEYMILTTALDYLKSVLYKQDISLMRVSVEVQTDSQLIVGHLTKNWKISAKNLLPLIVQAQSLIREFKSVTFTQTPRAKIFKTLGH